MVSADFVASQRLCMVAQEETKAAVTTANSMVGTTTNDNFGSGGVSALANGTFVVNSPNFDGTLANTGALHVGVPFVTPFTFATAQSTSVTISPTQISVQEQKCFRILFLSKTA